MKINEMSKEEIINNLEDEDIINQIYNLVRKYCWKNKIYSEDNVQDLIYEILKGINTFDNTKSKFTTWVEIVMHHKYLQKIRDSKAIKRQSNMNTISLNKIIDENENIEMLDLIQQPYDATEEFKKEIANYVYNNCLSKLTKDYFDGKSQVDLAIEYNISQSQVSKKIKKELKEIRKELNI